jgi:hypothetical protein
MARSNGEIRGIKNLPNRRMLHEKHHAVSAGQGTREAKAIADEERSEYAQAGQSSMRRRSSQESRSRLIELCGMAGTATCD